MAWYNIYPPRKGGETTAAQDEGASAAMNAASRSGPAVLARARMGDRRARGALALISAGARRGDPRSAAALLALRASWRQMSTRTSAVGRPLGLYQRGLLTSFLNARG